MASRSDLVLVPFQSGILDQPRTGQHLLEFYYSTVFGPACDEARYFGAVTEWRLQDC